MQTTLSLFIWTKYEMRMEITPEQVELGVSQFYADPSGKTELNTWLIQIQHSTHAWNFAWTLLSRNKSEEVQFFAGNTIYIKVSRYWHEVPQEEYDSLKIRILNYIGEFRNSKSILNRLIKALAAYILHTIEKDWPTALEDIISMFNPETISGLEPSTALDILFNILMIIPDELQNCQETMGIRNSNRQAIKDILKNNSHLVLSLSQQTMQANQVSNVTKELVLRTLNSWLQQMSLPLTDTKDLLISLIPYSNYGLLCEWVLECLRTAVTDTNSYSTPNTVIEFITQLLSLKSVLDEALGSEDENTASLIYSLFTAIVESHSRLLLSTALNETDRSSVVQVVSLLVDCAATPGQYPTQETLSSIPFAVWYTIQDDIFTFEKEQNEELISLFKPVYLKLVDTFLQKSLMPPEGVLSSEEKEMFRCYRQDICDTYMYAHNILKGDMLACLENHLKDGVKRIDQDPSNWRYLEAVLHAYSSIAETVAESDTYYVPRFIQSIPQIPFSDNMQLVSVALTTLGAYADWLNYHHDHLHHVIPLMVAGLVNNSLIGAASQALRDLTLECPLTIAPFSQPILQSCQKVLLHSPRLDSAETERIVTIFSRVLSVGMDDHSVMTYLNATMAPYIARITQIKEKLGNFITEDEKQELISLLKLFGCLARHLNVNNSMEDEEEIEVNKRLSNIQEPKLQPLLLILEPLIPVIAEISEKAANNSDVLEALCKLLKNSISTLRDDCLHILPPLLRMIPLMYQSSLNSCILDVVKQLITLYGRDDQQKSNMVMLLQLVVSATLTRASSDLWNYTDVVQAFLSLMAITLKRLPFLFTVQQLPSIFNLGMEALKLPEESTVKSASIFFSCFIVCSRDQNGISFQQVVSHNVENLLRTLCFCICNSPRHSLTSFSDVLTSLCKLYGDDLVQSFKLIQSDPSFPSPRISPQQKEEFAKKVLRNRGNKRKILEAVTDLALISRGIAGTEYGAQTRGFH
ncbi:UNVERIFIED_CONTAM: hypothetical protein RMT77_010090 [Armadillidium vulgare]